MVQPETEFYQVSIMERVMAIVTSKLGDTVMNEKVKILELFLFFWLYGI